MSDTPRGDLSWLGGVPVMLAVARRGSATAAAQDLGIGVATAIRRLSSLEQELGVSLFDRTPSGMLPTAAVERALLWAEQIEASAHSMQQELRGLELTPTGTVRMALLPLLSSWFIVPALPVLRVRHPELVLELVPDSSVADLARSEADLALRTVRPESGDLVMTRVATLKLAAVASPDLLAEVGPAQLTDLPWVDWDHRAVHAPENRWLATHVPEAKVIMRSSSLDTLLRAAQVRLGAVVVAEPLAAAAGLVRVPVETPPMPGGPLWLVAHRALRSVPRVAAVWNWIVEEFEMHHALGRFALSDGC